MKKIFAIALALVMVLSMASAFALNSCATWAPAWDCTADSTWCGKGTVEVVPYVKVNTSCGWEYQVSTCAAAVRTENVYFAIKVTADAYPDKDWWDEAKLVLNATGVTPAWDDLEVAITGIDMTEDESVVYYYASGVMHDSTDDDFDIADVMFTAVVDNENNCSTKGYKVCAELSSEYNGYATPKYNKVGDYKWNVTSNDSPIFNADGELIGGTIEVYDDDNKVVFTVEEGAIVATNWTEATKAFYNSVLADFGFNACGTAACITKDNIKANFGWDDEQESCFSWSTNGASVVDADCVVAIPKTGDVSVVAYAVMAVVAAAGTMLKK